MAEWTRETEQLAFRVAQVVLDKFRARRSTSWLRRMDLESVYGAALTGAVQAFNLYDHAANTTLFTWMFTYARGRALQEERRQYPGTSLEYARRNTVRTVVSFSDLLRETETESGDDNILDRKLQWMDEIPIDKWDSESQAALALAALEDEREKRVIHMRYFEGMSQQEVAEIIGLHQMSVSRIERKALSRMRVALGKLK
jgi:RNA polymerase sigma factor (sigma-70 family)